MAKVSQNEKRLAKLLREAYAACSEAEAVQSWDASYAAFLAKRGVLAVCAATVPQVPQFYRHRDAVVFLRRVARGQR